MKISSVAFALLAAVTVAPVAAEAATITYTYTSTFTGTNNGNPFVTAATFIGTGDTNNVVTFNGSFPAVPLSSFIADNNGTIFTITTPFLFAWNSAQGVAGFVVDGTNGFVFSSPDLIGYDGVSNLTTATAPSFTVSSFSTDRGEIVLTAQDVGTFTASVAAVPEPASWALMISGLAMTGVAMRRRKVSIAA